MRLLIIGLFSSVVVVTACGGDNTTDNSDADDAGAVDVGDHDAGDIAEDSGRDSSEDAEDDASSVNLTRVYRCTNNPSTSLDDCPYGECEEDAFSETTCDGYDEILAIGDVELCVAGDAADYALDLEEIENGQQADSWTILVHCNDGEATTERCDGGFELDESDGLWACRP